MMKLRLTITLSTLAILMVMFIEINKYTICLIGSVFVILFCEIIASSILSSDGYKSSGQSLRIVSIFIESIRSIELISAGIFLLCMPVLFDTVMELYLTLGNDATLSSLANLNTNVGITSSEFIYNSITVVSVLVMSLLAYLSYQINRQQFDLLEQINNPVVYLRVHTINPSLNFKVKFSEIENFLEDDILDLPLEYMSTGKPFAFTLDKNPIISSISGRIECQLHCANENKTVLVHDIYGSRSDELIKASVESINGDKTKKIEIVSSNELTKYVVEISSDNYTCGDYYFLDLEFHFETDFEIVTKRMSIDVEAIHSAIQLELKSYINKVKLKNWQANNRPSLPHYLEPSISYKCLKDILDNNKENAIYFKLDNIKIEEVR